MKIFLLSTLILFSTLARADQADALEKQRDHFLENSRIFLKRYCPQADDYVCRQQLEIDCAHGLSERKVKACPVLEKVKNLEKLIVLSDKNLAQVAQVDLPTNAPAQSKIDVPAVVPEIIPSAPVASPSKPQYIKVNIKLSSDRKMAIEQNAPAEEIQKLLSGLEKINSKKIRIDCDSKADCRYLEYGHNPCGGPMDYFPYSIKDSSSSELVSEIKSFTASEQEFVKKWNVGISGLCVWKGAPAEAGCADNVCR